MKSLPGVPLLLGALGLLAIGGRVRTGSRAHLAALASSITPETPLYHGTRHDFETFVVGHPERKDEGWLGHGVYLTADPALAESYARIKRGPVSPRVMEVRARLQNPYIAEEGDKKDVADRGYAGSAKATAELVRRGHDGVLLRLKNGSIEVVVFDPARVQHVATRVLPPIVRRKRALSRAGSRDHASLDLTKVKILRKKVVFHVGASVAAQKQAHRGGKPGSSYEGEGLSVSEHPRAWTKIAQLGGSPTWALARADGKSGRFVDMHALRASPLVRRRVDAFLVDAGLIVPKTAYTVTWFDDELDREVMMRFETRAEAEAEFAEFADDPEERPIRPALDWGPTARLAARWATHFSGALHPGMAWDYAFLCALDEVASSLDVDGAWWDDDLDPRGYSAPRGVILPSRVAAWTWRPAKRTEGKDDSWEDE